MIRSRSTDTLFSLTPAAATALTFTACFNHPAIAHTPAKPAELIKLLELASSHNGPMHTCLYVLMQQPVKSEALALHKLWGKSEDQIVKALGKADEPPGGPPHSLAYFRVKGKGTITFLNDSKYSLRFDFDHKPRNWRAALTSAGIPVAGISARPEPPEAQGNMTDGLELRRGVFARMKGLADASFGNAPLLDGSGRKWALFLEARDNYYAPQSGR